MKRIIPALMPLPLLACAADITNYPSLARRDAEKVVAASQIAPTPSISQTPSNLTARLVALVENARLAHQSFDSRKAKAERAVVASGNFGSEAWGSASIALADLESARSDAMIALADLDEVYAKTRIDGADASPIIAARNQVIAWVGEEDRVLAKLRSQLNR